MIARLRVIPMKQPNIPVRGEQSKPKLWQGSSLRSFGMNPYGDNLWRVVWGPSRKYLVGGPWQDRIGEVPTDSEMALAGKDLSIVREVIEYRWVPKYPEAWVLEKWLSPLHYGGTPSQWVTTQSQSEQIGCFLCAGDGCDRCHMTGKVDGPLKWLTLGPYPTRGEFEACYTFPEGEPTYSMITSVIDMLVYGSEYTPAERRAAIEAQEQGKKWDWRNKCEAIWKDSQGAFNNAPSNVNPAKRTAEDIKFDIHAEDLNLPGPGSFGQRSPHNLSKEN